MWQDGVKTPKSLHAQFSGAQYWGHDFFARDHDLLLFCEYAAWPAISDQSVWISERKVLFFVRESHKTPLTLIARPIRTAYKVPLEVQRMHRDLIRVGDDIEHWNADSRISRAIYLYLEKAPWSTREGMKSMLMNYYILTRQLHLITNAAGWNICGKRWLEFLLNNFSSWVLSFF